MRCSVDIQRGMAERNVRIPENRRVEFRVGINVGDVIIEEGDIFGDGVNIAARPASPGVVDLLHNDNPGAPTVSPAQWHEQLANAFHLH